MIAYRLAAPRRPGVGELIRVLTLRLLPLLLLAVSGCAAEEQPGTTSSSDSIKADTGGGAGSRQPPQRSNAPEAMGAPPARAPRTAAEERLQARLGELGKAFDGHVGIAVRDIAAGWTAQFGGTGQFPQQSVSKLWVALALLDQVDRGALNLGQKVTLRRSDLTLFYQPIRGPVLRDGEFTTTLGDLLARAISRSDNTANDFLLRKVGGPEAIRRALAEKGLSGIRFGPGERQMQSAIAGLEWKPEYSVGRAFFEAREEVPSQRRRATFNAYLEDPVDGATPAAIANALARLKQGELLSPAATQLLLSIMAKTKSGPRRLKGGLAPGWSIYHKTGTGQVFEDAQSGYNDVGLLTSPAGRAYSVVVLIGRTRQSVTQRMQLMHRVVQAVTAYDGSTDRSQPPRT